MAALCPVELDEDGRCRPLDATCARCGGVACGDCDRCHGCGQIVCEACNTEGTPPFQFPGDEWKHPHNVLPLRPARDPMHRTAAIKALAMARVVARG